MGAEVVVMGELPLVPPIKTAPIRDKPAEDRRLEVTSTDDDDCVTPKSEEHVLKPVLVCPPAPRKPKPARRAPAAAPSREFRAVPRDLTSVFLSLPPKKRIRSNRVAAAGCWNLDRSGGGQFRTLTRSSEFAALDPQGQAQRPEEAVGGRRDSSRRAGQAALATGGAEEVGRRRRGEDKQSDAVATCCRWTAIQWLALGKPSKQRLRSTNGRPLESSRVAEINGGEDLEMAQRGETSR
ncbi:hypothetical protein BHM03_00049810 [Ensete ventricosum]|nr:hypothetical protein BHM03_00049810 [Ensete ventricosum]